MSISVTEILGTDSISGSRITLNSNFDVVVNEINLMENYFDPSSGIIDNLTSLVSNTLTVGLSSTLFDVTGSGATFNAATTFNGDVTLTGLLNKNNIESTTITTDLSIGSPSTAPDNYVYRVGNSTGTANTISLYDGEIGQEVVFVAAEAMGNDVDIVPAGTASLIGGTKVTLDTLGQSVKLMIVTNSVSAKEWYVVGGNGYTVS